MGDSPQSENHPGWNEQADAVAHKLLDMLDNVVRQSALPVHISMAWDGITLLFMVPIENPQREDKESPSFWGVIEDEWSKIDPSGKTDRLEERVKQGYIHLLLFPVLLTIPARLQAAFPKEGERFRRISSDNPEEEKWRDMLEIIVV